MLLLGRPCCLGQGPYTVPNYDLFGHHHHSKPFKVGVVFGLQRLFFVLFHTIFAFLRAGCVSPFFLRPVFFLIQEMQDKSDFLQREVHASVDLRIRSLSQQIFENFGCSKTTLRFAIRSGVPGLLFSGTPEAELMFLWRTSFFWGGCQIFSMIQRRNCWIFFSKKVDVFLKQFGHF